MRRRDLLAAVGAGLGSTVANPAAAWIPAPMRAVPYARRAEVAAYLDQLAARHGLERDWLQLVVAQGRYCRDAERLTTPARSPTAPLNWHAYRARHVDAPRIAEGVAFWREHAAVLGRVEERFGVGADVIVAIFGTETRFGRLTGNYVALDVLLTLAFDYTRRADLYRDELAEYLRLCADRHFDPYHTRSSFAGALGLPQFLPSSVRRYAIDFDGDDTIDLHRSVADAAGSIGNYLAAQGWQRTQPVALAVRDGAVPAVVAPLAATGLEANLTWGELAERGVGIDGELAPGTAVMLVALPCVDDGGEITSEFRIGTANFAALLQYNRSYFYAAALVDFAAEVRQAAGITRIA
jgi:membrane-bound lytic murein transglycosylase B